MEALIGHAFWCERTRTGSVASECTCTAEPMVRSCTCGHLFGDHLGNGAFCRFQRVEIHPCTGFDPVMLPVSSWAIGY